jgi:integrase
LIVFYFLFYFDRMQTHETASTPAVVSNAAVHHLRFNSARDARNRKVRGLWKRGERYYLQTRVPGEKSARKIPLLATTLTEAKEEMAKQRTKARDGSLPKGGVKPSLTDYVTDYLDYHTKNQSGRKASTVTRERTALTQWVQKLGHVRIDKLSKPMIAAFVKDRIRDGISPRTANLDVIVLRNVLKSALDDGLLVTLPMAGIRPLKTVAKKRPTLTPADFDRLLTACVATKEDGSPVTKNGEQLRDYIVFLAYCGARCNEALQVKWADVDFTNRLVCIGADGNSKNSKARHVDFNPDLERHLRAMWDRRAPDSQWLFPSPQRGPQDIPAKTLRESFKLARTAAGLTWVGFHDFRHYFASVCVMSHIDFKTIAEWLGHQDGGVLLCKVYSHLLDGHKRDMAARLVFTPTILPSPEPEITAAKALPKTKNRQ